MINDKTFAGYKILVEIYNNGIDESRIFHEKITDNGGIIQIFLNKQIDYIVFKDGSSKTLKYGFDNNIKVVNPLWIDDMIKGKVKDLSTYLIPKHSLTEISLKVKYVHPEILKEKKKKERKIELLGIKRNKEKNEKSSQILDNFKITSFFKKMPKEGK